MIFFSGLSKNIYFVQLLIVSASKQIGLGFEIPTTDETISKYNIHKNCSAASIEEDNYLIPAHNFKSNKKYP